jgi:N-acetylneuraminic acid mutarotase
MLIALMVLPGVNLNLSQAKSADTQSSWTTITPMPTARGGFGIAVVSGKIYAIGGLNGNNLPVGTTEEYDPQTNQWTSMTSMPTPRSGFAVAVFQNKIYAIGGTVGNGFASNNEVFDPVSNTWETKTSMPIPREDLCANVVGDKIYLIGGKRYSSITPFYNETDINEVYNPSNDTWSTAAPLPIAVQGYSSVVLNGKIYIIGGSTESMSLQNTLITDATQVFDPKSGNWSTTEKLPNVDSYGAAAATEGYMVPSRIYCIGGYSNEEFSSQVQVYYPENHSWNTEESMPTARSYLGVAVVNDVLYAIGGFDGTNWLDVNEQYKPIGYGTVPPKVEINSPENNKTYSAVTLDFTINRGTQWMGYSVDNHANVTVRSETKLSGLSEGDHTVTIYANDSLGNMGTSNTIFFSVDILPPNIIIMLPQNQSYGSSDIQLTFTVNEAVSNLAYSLDGQGNVTINGNLTLPALADGSHRLTLYATDEVGNLAEKTVFFNIAPFPVVAVVAVLTIVIIAVAGGYLFLKRRKLSDTKQTVAIKGPSEKPSDSGKSGP